MRVRRPFWTHQIVEYLVGIVLISAAVQQPQPTVPALLGLAILLNAAIAKGPAGAFRLVGHRLHRQLDVVLMVLLLGGAVQPWVSLDNSSRFILGAIAFVMFFVWFHTDYTERVPRAERKVQRAAAAREPGADRGGYTSESVARGAGRLAGRGVNSVKRWKDGLGDA